MMKRLWQAVFAYTALDSCLMVWFDFQLVPGVLQLLDMLYKSPWWNFIGGTLFLFINLVCFINLYEIKKETEERKPVGESSTHIVMIRRAMK